MSLAEKFQIMAPPEPEPGHTWDTVQSVHRHKGSVQNDPANGQKFNYMPKGMETNVADNFGSSIAGATDVSNNVTSENLQRGFFRAAMQGTDDQYSGEHLDLFYGEVEDELGNCGFVERNNYLDRL